MSWQAVKVRPKVAVTFQSLGVPFERIAHDLPELTLERLQGIFTPRGGIRGRLVKNQVQDIEDIHPLESIGHCRQSIGASAAFPVVIAETPEFLGVAGKLRKLLGYRGLDKGDEANAETNESLPHDLIVLYRLVQGVLYRLV